MVLHILNYSNFEEIIMNHCADLYLLSTIACELAKCLTEDELTILAINLTTLGDMLAVIATKQAICAKELE